MLNRKYFSYITLGLKSVFYFLPLETLETRAYDLGEDSRGQQIGCFLIVILKIIRKIHFWVHCDFKGS